MQIQNTYLQMFYNPLSDASFVMILTEVLFQKDTRWQYMLHNLWWGKGI